MTTNCRSNPPVLLPSFVANLLDVLSVLELSEDMEGVSLESGLCTSRQGRNVTDLSFRIDKKIQLSAPTSQLFPGNAAPLARRPSVCSSVLM